MRTLRICAWIVAAFMAASCGGGSGGTLTGDGSTGPGTTVDVGTVSLSVSSPTLASDNTEVVTVTALVLDQGNATAENVPVTFQADTGQVSNVNSPTDINGEATADLRSGSDPSNRMITVTATADDISGTITVAVDGTSLSIAGPQDLTQGDMANYQVTLTRADGAGIAGETLDVTSDLGNTLSSATLTTDGSGSTNFDLTADNAGDDTLTVTGLGLTATINVAISDDTFSFVSPGSGANIALNTPRNVTVLWEQDGSPVVGRTVTFTQTRTPGPTPTSAVTDPSGQATVSVQGDTAGAAVIVATNEDGVSTALNVNYVATQAATLALNASVATVPTGGQSTLTAVVKDPAGNLVANKVVVFELTDVSGGTLSAPQGTTDNLGKTQVVYTAGGSPTAQDQVAVRAFVLDTPTVEGNLSLTVARRELFISIGTGNLLNEVGQSQFSQEWAIQVSDSVGNAISNSNVQASIVSVNYIKGFYAVNIAANQWVKNPTATCQDEDTLLETLDPTTARNGILDDLGGGNTEDFNGSGQLEAGNIALVSAVAPEDTSEAPCATPGGAGQAADVVTNSAGTARVCVLYPQSFNGWVEVEIEARAAVEGTEFAENQTFILPPSADDINNIQASPPGEISPFGLSGSCADTL